MRWTPEALASTVLAAVIGLACIINASAQQSATPDQASGAALPSVVSPPGPFKPNVDDDTPAPAKSEALPDVWIFSGALQNSHETFSGTLVAKKGDAQFELKLSGGATCDGSDVSGDVGLVRLSEITCTDDRRMRALFVPQNGQELKVFGHVGDERFATNAHLLGTEAVPDAPQTAEPTAPALQRRPGDPLSGPPPAGGGGKGH